MVQHPGGWERVVWQQKPLGRWDSTAGTGAAAAAAVAAAAVAAAAAAAAAAAHADDFLMNGPGPKFLVIDSKSFC
jgi:hypothetical protein